MDRRCDLPRVTRQLPPASKLSSPGCNTQVEETGCEILPDFADGAKLLVPINKWWTVQSECGKAARDALTSIHSFG